MPETKKLNPVEPTIDGHGLDKSEIRERQFATLLNNDLVAGDARIAERILSVAKPIKCGKGKKIISQGADDDCAYFIISGSVDIRINRKHIDFRSAPYAVGEMAAKRAGEARTADVVVVSQRFEALALSGREFRALMRDFDSFSDNLNSSIDTLSRKKIIQLGEKVTSGGWSWNMISSAVGGACGLATALATWLGDFSITEVALMSGAVGVFGFVAMILINPVLRYRNMYSAAGVALITVILYGSISYVLTINGENVELPLIDFSVRTEQKVGMLVVGAIALVIFSYISGAFDLKLNQTRDDESK